MSVSWKKTKETLWRVFNPDTYTLGNYKATKRYMALNKTELYIGAFIVTIHL